MHRHIAPPRYAPGRPLTLAQKRTLVALVRACPAMGEEACADVVSELSGIKPNATVLTLQGLVRRKLAVEHEDPQAWSPTLSGRGLARYVRAADPRTAPLAEADRRRGS